MPIGGSSTAAFAADELRSFAAADLAIWLGAVVGLKPNSITPSGSKLVADQLRKPVSNQLA